MPVQVAGPRRLATVLLLGSRPFGGQCFGVRRELVAGREHRAAAAPHRGAPQRRRPAAARQDRVAHRRQALGASRERRRVLGPRAHRAAGGRLRVPAR